MLPDVLGAVVEGTYPLIDLPHMVQCLLVRVTYCRFVWLDQNILFALRLASQSDGILVCLQNFGVWADYYRSTVFCHVLVIVQHAIVLQLEKSKLLLPKPVLFD